MYIWNLVVMGIKIVLWSSQENSCYSLNLKNVEDELLSQYADIAISDGQITLQDFAKYLGIPESEPALIDLFKLYDKVKSCGIY